MGLTSALSVGRSALAAYQAALQIAGNNIANLATPGYTRTSPNLAALPGPNTRAGQIGEGVWLSAVRRNASEPLETRLRTALSDRESAASERAGLSRIEGILDPLGDTNLGALLADFFKAVGNLQNNPENIATRGLVITSGQAVAGRIRDIRADLDDLTGELNDQILTATSEADQIASQIADLNIQITVAESASNGQASALRDQRNQLLGRLSELFSVTVREQPSGAINVYVGNEALVQFGQSAGLKAAVELDAAGRSVVVVRFRQSNGQVKAGSGMIDGLINARDQHLGGQLVRLDTLAAGIIQEVNRVHAGGQGLQGFSSLTSTTAVIDPSLTLATSTNGIAFMPKSGSFFIDVKDAATGTLVRRQINIDLDGLGSDSTLTSVAADITSSVPGLTATVLPDGRLQLSAAPGSTFTFADDTSGFLASLGLNTFFTGSGSLDIDINPLIAASPALVAAATAYQPGDGSNATAMAALQNQAVASLGGISLNDYYTGTTSVVAVASSSAQGTLEAGAIIFDSLTAQRESVSGVNLDEEAAKMIAYQRAFEGAARYMGVIDEMLQTLLGLVR
jgi:flagellar hook-associated protein 1 FlgK